MENSIASFLVALGLIFSLFHLSNTQSGNIALNKPAQQVGTYDGHTAGRAVDGRTSQNLGDNSCAHPSSNSGSSTWWRVDLQGTYSIYNVTLYLRSDCCTDRNVGITLGLGEREDIATHQSCGITSDAIETFQCIQSPVQYVSLRSNKNNMGICEVIIHGVRVCPRHFYGTNCDGQCYCKGQQPCSRSGECEEGCDEFHVGSDCSKDKPRMPETPLELLNSTPTSVRLSFVISDPPANEYELQYQFAHDTRDQSQMNGPIITPNPDFSVQTIERGNLESGQSYNFVIYPYIIQDGMRYAGLPSPVLRVDLPAASTTTTEPTTTSATSQPTPPPTTTTTASREGTTSELEDPSSDPSSVSATVSTVSPTVTATATIPPDPMFSQATGTSAAASTLAGPQFTGGKAAVPVPPEVDSGNYPPPVPTSSTSGPDDTSGPSNVPVEQTEGPSGGMIGGIIVAVLLALALAVIIIVLIRRRRQGKQVPLFAKLGNVVKLGRDKQKNVDSPPIISAPIGVEEVSPEVVVVEEAAPSGASTPAYMPGTPDLDHREEPYSNIVLLPAIRASELGAYIETKKNIKDGFKEEYKKLPVGPTRKWDVGNKPENRNKNRFLNIRAYDHSRVKLEPEPGDIHSDYINADYISGYGGAEKTYIAAQGPKKLTIDDMWRLVWQTNTNRIVMVTNLVESGRAKCEQYWPQKNSETYGKIKVTLLNTNRYAPYEIRIFSVQNGEESRVVRQFHFTSWPDHGVPTVATDLLEFRRRVKSFDHEATGPLLIHCSAGVGRSGTYIAIDYCLEQAKHEDEVNVWAVTFQMRSQRVNMIQTLDQYIFVYNALHEAIVSGETCIRSNMLGEVYPKLCRVDPETKQSILEKQLKVLDMLKTPQQEENLVALQDENIKKNRSKDIVPSNRYRPFLSIAVEGTTSYINAVYVDSFRSKLAYVITQMPLPHTVVDFWRLIHDHHSSSIIMLNDLEETDKSVGVYWPEDQEQVLTFGPMDVTMTSVNTENSDITIREFTINSKNKKNPATVKQFQITSWPKTADEPQKKAVLLDVIEMVEKWQQKAQGGPVTIHCLDGVTRCGLMAATMYLMEQLKVDQELDVFHAVKHVRIPRPQLVADLDQYKFVHEMALEYTDKFSEYSNFS